MSISKLLILLVVALTVAVPVGTVRADAHWEGTGTAVISDGVAGADQIRNGTITYVMSGVTAPDEGTAYEGWLVTDDGSIKLSTGIMTVNEDGTIHHHFASPSGQDLIHNYDKVLITVEPIPDADPGPSGVFAFSDKIPAGGMAHIRHLLTNWPPGTDKGILTNLKEQLDLAILHANLALNSDTIEGIRQHAEHVINIIEGEDGANFGDLDGDGSVQNPGDGIGVLTHAADRKHAGFAAGVAPKPTLVEFSSSVDITGKGAQDWATLARNVALDNIINATPSVLLAKIWLGPGAGSIISNLESARWGFDTDNDGTIEAIVGEGGAAQAYVEAQKMATYTMVLGALPTPAVAAGQTTKTGPSIGLPSSGGRSRNPTARPVRPDSRPGARGCGWTAGPWRPTPTRKGLSRKIASRLKRPRHVMAGPLVRYRTPITCPKSETQHRTLPCAARGRDRPALLERGQRGQKAGPGLLHRGRDAGVSTDALLLEGGVRHHYRAGRRRHRDRPGHGGVPRTVLRVHGRLRVPAGQ